jgi:hypothetical protein
MKALLGLTLVAVLLIGAAPAYSGEAVQMWKCEMDDDASEAQVKAMSAKWLEAVKKQPGGEQFEAYVLFPVAVNATGEMDVMFVVVAPSFQEWGKFWDAYGGSPAAALERENEALVVCPDSVVWESFKVE